MNLGWVLRFGKQMQIRKDPILLGKPSIGHLFKPNNTAHRPERRDPVERIDEVQAHNGKVEAYLMLVYGSLWKFDKDIGYIEPRHEVGRDDDALVVEINVGHLQQSPEGFEEFTSIVIHEGGPSLGQEFGRGGGLAVVDGLTENVFIVRVFDVVSHGVEWSVLEGTNHPFRKGE